jgi:NAD-dependent SIR2 family protein deacetylase
MSLKLGDNDEGDSEVSGYRRWVDGKLCCYKACASVISPEDACVVIATDEAKRRRLPKTRDSVVAWNANGRQVMHRVCFDKLGPKAFTSKSELALFRAGDETAEYFDGQSTVQQAAAETAKLFWSVLSEEEATKPSPAIVAFTGAGISASAGIPTYRGTNGIDTKNDMKHCDDSSATEEETAFPSLQPTATHRHLATLEQQGWLSYIASQNCDNLHGKAGTSRDYITELHGNVFIEYCAECRKEYIRTYEVDPYSTDCYKEKYFVKCGHCGFGHYTGRRCNVSGCRGKLRDTIVNFGDPLHTEVLGGLTKASGKFLAADVCMALGSSLSVSPANMLVTLPHFLVVVNPQSTDADSDADIRVWAESDQFMNFLMAELEKGPSQDKPLAIRSRGGGGKKSWTQLKDEIEYSREQEVVEAAESLVATRQSRRKRTRG